jgi:hypothetical protein
MNSVNTLPDGGATRSQSLSLRSISFMPTAGSPDDRVESQVGFSTAELKSLRDALNRALDPDADRLVP